MRYGRPRTAEERVRPGLWVEDRRIVGQRGFGIEDGRQLLVLALDREAALAHDAPVLHPEAGTNAFLGGTRSAVTHPTVQGHGLREHGDVEAGFGKSHRVYEHTFTIPR